MQDFKQKIDQQYALRCKGCNGKVLDPDKKNKQEFFKYVCPICGFDYRNRKNKKHHTAITHQN